METSSITNILGIYGKVVRRHPVVFTVTLLVTTAFYIWFLDKIGIINIPSFTQPTIAIRFEPTEIYDAGSTQLGLKRVRLLPNSKELIGKVTTTIEAPSFAELTFISTPSIKADISKFESPNGRRRFEILCRSVESKQELVFVLVGAKSPSWREAPFSKDVAVVVEVVASTKGGRLFGASAVGEFSLRDSEQSQSSKEEALR